jgi:glutamate dehydrogenase/leucine dehydrogenase
MITGYGVAEAVRHYYETYGGDVKESHCARFWNVASRFLFAEMGAKVIGIIDRDGGLINENGFTLKK